MIDTLSITALLALLAAFGPILDKISSTELKTKVYRNLASTNRRSFAAYVAGNALSIFQRVFGSRFLSKRFVLTSLTLTVTFAIGALFFLYFIVPATFFASTSYWRHSLANPMRLPAAILPIILFIGFDYIGNGQTKYFLGLMKHAPGLGRFLVIGYADLVVTLSIGIASVAFSFLLFTVLALAAQEKDMRAWFDFGLSDEHLEIDSDWWRERYKQGKAVLFSSGIHYSYYDKQLIKRDSELLEMFSQQGDYVFRESTQDGSRVIQRINRRGVVEQFLSDRDVQNAHVMLLLEEYANSYAELCGRVARAPTDSQFQVRVDDGWDEDAVESACIEKRRVDIVYSGAIRLKGLKYRTLLADTAGLLVSLSVSSLIEGFSYYLLTGPDEVVINSSNWHNTYLLGDRKGPEAFVNRVLTRGWLSRHGGYRVLEKSSYPWSTFFVVTLLTSGFIWIVLIVTSLLYPAIWLLERAMGETTRPFEVSTYPFTTLFLIGIPWLVLGIGIVEYVF